MTTNSKFLDRLSIQTKLNSLSPEMSQAPGVSRGQLGLFGQKDDKSSGFWDRVPESSRPFGLISNPESLQIWERPGGFWADSRYLTVFPQCLHQAGAQDLLSQLGFWGESKS